MTALPMFDYGDVIYKMSSKHALRDWMPSTIQPSVMPLVHFFPTNIVMTKSCKLQRSLVDCSTVPVDSPLGYIY